MSENLRTHAYSYPAHPGQRPPHLLEELNPEGLQLLGAALGPLTNIPLPESAQNQVRPGVRPYLEHRAALGSIAAEGFTHIAEALPAIQLLKEHVDTDTDIRGKDIARHFSAVRALIPLTRKALEVAPEIAEDKARGVGEGADSEIADRAAYEARLAMRRQFAPLERKLTMYRVAGSIASLVGLGWLVDRWVANKIAKYVNTHRHEIRGYLETTYDNYIRPTSEAMTELAHSFPRPQEQFMFEARALADSIWARAESDTPGSKEMGRAIQAELEALGEDEEAAASQFPLLSRFGLTRLLTPPDTFPVSGNFLVRYGLRKTHTAHSDPYKVRDKYGISRKKVDIPTADILAVAALEIMSALESAATPNEETARRLKALYKNRHPLRIPAIIFSPSVSSQILGLRSASQFMAAVRTLLPVDSAHAQRIANALEDTLRPKPLNGRTR